MNNEWIHQTLDKMKKEKKKLKHNHSLSNFIVRFVIIAAIILVIILNFGPFSSQKKMNYICPYCAFEIFDSIYQITVTCPQCDEMMQEIKFIR